MKNLNELFEKYPKIFSLMLDERGMSCHVPNPWLKTIDSLCKSMQEHIDNNNINNKHLPPIEQIVCEQIKDKFGYFNFYYKKDTGDGYCYGMIKLATTILWDTCELCGSTEKVQNQSNPYWIRRVCWKCEDEYKLTKKDS